MKISCWHYRYKHKQCNSKLKKLLFHIPCIIFLYLYLAVDKHLVNVNVAFRTYYIALNLGYFKFFSISWDSCSDSNFQTSISLYIMEPPHFPLTDMLTIVLSCLFKHLSNIKYAYSQAPVSQKKSRQSLEVCF